MLSGKTINYPAACGGEFGPERLNALKSERQERMSIGSNAKGNMELAILLGILMLICRRKTELAII
jgi:hypothetical protein